MLPASRQADFRRKRVHGAQNRVGTHGTPGERGLSRLLWLRVRQGRDRPGSSVTSSLTHEPLWGAWAQRFQGTRGEREMGGS